MPRCHRCNIDFRTRQNLVQHLESSHPSVSSSSMVVPTVYDLIVMVGCPWQTLFCPHPYCLFMVKEVASTHTLARHFQKKHPDHDLQIKYKCEQCDIFIDPDRRADHVREHLDYVNCPNTSSTDYGNVSFMAPADESLPLSYTIPWRECSISFNWITVSAKKLTSYTSSRLRGNLLTAK